MQSKATQPKIGVALSGASGRAIAHIGVLEVFKENNIQIDFIAACSSGALVAAAYATDSMEFLKKWFFEADMKKLLRFWSMKGAKGGLFQIKEAEEDFHKIMKGLRFEDVYPKLGFIATDLNTGEVVTLSMGDMLQAFKATVAVPGLFEPVVWGNKILVDGGLANIVPTVPVKQMGADIVIGVNLAATKFIYEKRLPMWKGYRLVTKILGFQFIREKILSKFSSRLLFKFDSQADLLENEDIQVPGLLTVLTKALDHALETSENWKESDMLSDLMLEPRVKHYGKTDFKNLKKIYLEGRRSATASLPELKRLIDQYKQPDQKLNRKLSVGTGRTV